MHLGGIIAADCCITLEINSRVSSAMSAYVPIAIKFFGSRPVSVHLKSLFLGSFILSRLLYNVHTLTMTVPALKKINGTYMRVLRRIADDPRYSVVVLHSDLEIRRILGQPSIDSILLRKRLLYGARLAHRQPAALLALLQVNVNGVRLPWVLQFTSDLDAVFMRSPAACRNLPPPHQQPAVWLLCMKEDGEVI